MYHFYTGLSFNKACTLPSILNKSNIGINELIRQTLGVFNDNIQDSCDSFQDWYSRTFNKLNSHAQKFSKGTPERQFLDSVDDICFNTFLVFFKFIRVKYVVYSDIRDFKETCDKADRNFVNPTTGKTAAMEIISHYKDIDNDGLYSWWSKPYLTEVLMQYDNPPLCIEFPSEEIKLLVVGAASVSEAADL